MNSLRRRALGITYSPQEGWEVVAATPADGDGAGGSSSHPDVTEQKDRFRHQQNAATSAGEGRCVQLSPGSEQEETKNSASSRNHGETLWSQTVASPLEEPRGSTRQPPHAVLGTKRDWFNPRMFSAVRSGCFRVLAQLLLPLRPQLAGAACHSRWMPHA